MLLTRANGEVLKAVYTSPPLGNYSYDDFKGFSPPIHVAASGLRLAYQGRLFVTLKVINHDRNLQIPLDDRAGGWNVSVGWA